MAANRQYTVESVVVLVSFALFLYMAVIARAVLVGILVAFLPPLLYLAWRYFARIRGGGGQPS